MKARRHLVPAIAPLLLLAACSEPSPTQMLQSRVTTSMSPLQDCNRPATVEYLPNGARIQIPDTALFVIGRTDLSACGQYAMASAIQAMLDQRIMQVTVEPGGDISAPYAYLPRERAGTLQAYLTNVGFTGFQPPVLVAPTSSASGVWAIVLTVAERG